MIDSIVASKLNIQQHDFGLMFFIIIIHLKPEKRNCQEMISKGRLIPTICTRQRQQWHWFRLICIHCNIYTAIWTILNHGSSCSFKYVYLLRIDSNCNDQNNKELWPSKRFSNCVCLFFKLCLSSVWGETFHSID